MQRFFTDVRNLRKDFADAGFGTYLIISGTGAVIKKFHGKIGMKTRNRIVDVHCHILPALDDGSRSLEESIEMLRIAEKSGITDIIATPHFKAGRLNPGPETIRQRIRTVHREALERGISVNLYPGNEVLFFSELEEVLAAGRICTLNDSPYMLVEFSPGDSYRFIRNALDQVMGMDLFPIVAHAERYGCLLEDWKNVEALRDMGAEIQINASSITGQAGVKIKRLTGILLGRRLVDYIGTDAHGSRARIPDLGKCLKRLEHKCDEAYIEKILCGNAMKLLEPQERRQKTSFPDKSPENGQEG